MHTCVQMHIPWAYVCGGQRIILVIFLYHSSACFLETMSHRTQKLPFLVSLPDQQDSPASDPHRTGVTGMHSDVQLYFHLFFLFSHLSFIEPPSFQTSSVLMPFLLPLSSSIMTWLWAQYCASFIQVMTPTVRSWMQIPLTSCLETAFQGAPLHYLASL